MAAALYALAAVGLLWQLGEHPPFPYNWESYTARNVWLSWRSPGPDPASILAVTDGLMTDSGRGPLVGLPAWLGLAWDGVRLMALRWPVALLAALAVPLAWLVSRRLTSGPVALVAAVLLAVSPVFLLYGRTATLVGISLVPALLTIFCLIRVLEIAPARERWHGVGWVVALQGSLLAGAYAYAPVRLLWPLTLIALLAAALAWPERRRFLALTGVASALVLPAFLVGQGWLVRGVWSAEPLAGYFKARGEQVFNLGLDPERYEPYLRESATATEPWGVLAQLVGQNLMDTLRLLSDWDTAPVATDYWHAGGQLWPWPLAPFFWLGLAGLVVGVVRWRSWRAALTLLLLLGMTGPLLLTTQVHVGRMVPALPLLLLTVASGVGVVGDGVARLVGGRLPAAAAQGITIAGLGVILVASSVVTAVSGYALLPTSSPESRVAERLAGLVSEVAEHGGAAIVAPAAFGLEIEGVRAGAYWLSIDDAYRLVDLSRPLPDPETGDPRPPLYVVGVLPALAEDRLPNACANLYLVMPEALNEFQQVTASAQVRRLCPGGLAYEVLPD